MQVLSHDLNQDLLYLNSIRHGHLVENKLGSVLDNNGNYSKIKSLRGAVDVYIKQHFMSIYWLVIQKIELHIISSI